MDVAARKREDGASKKEQKAGFPVANRLETLEIS